MTVVRRMSWMVSIEGRPEFRRDVNEGTEGVVEGWADLGQKQILLKVLLDLPGGPRSVVHQAYPRNLQLTQDYKLAQAGEASSAGSSSDNRASETASSPNKVPGWLLDNDDASRVKTEPNWTRLLSDADSLNKTFWLKSRVGVCLEALQENLPTYSEKDLHVAHRQSDKGVWRTELWTKRAFGPQELVFAPLSSQVEDTT